MAEHIVKELAGRAVTHGPNFHFFGYYDKFPWDSTGRYLLALEVDFINRSPGPDDVARICRIDLERDCQLEVLAETRAWNWQQGSMLYWLPSAPDRLVLFNDREGDHFVARILDLATGKMRTLPRPVYAVSPDGTYGISANFARIHVMRPGYGYNGPPDPWQGVLCPDNDGLYHIDLATGKYELIATYAEVAAIRHLDEMDDRPHWFNHIQINTDGSRIAVIHRYKGRESGHRSRLITMNPDGSDKFCVADHMKFSHYDWRDRTHFLAWARHPDVDTHYLLFTDHERGCRVIGADVLTDDGHCSFSPDRRWVLTDTYPRGEEYRRVILYRWPDGPRIDIGRFHSPPVPDGEFRCDLHPRWNRDGRQVCIDSAHVEGRQMHLLDVAEIVGDPAYR